MTGLSERLRFRRDHRWVEPRASKYLDGDLGPDERARLEHHLGVCPECRALLDGLRAVIGSLGALGAQEPPVIAPALLTAIRGQLQEPPA